MAVKQRALQGRYTFYDGIEHRVIAAPDRSFSKKGGSGHSRILRISAGICFSSSPIGKPRLRLLIFNDRLSKAAANKLLTSMPLRLGDTIRACRLPIDPVHSIFQFRFTISVRFHFLSWVNYLLRHGMSEQSAFVSVSDNSSAIWPQAKTIDFPFFLFFFTAHVVPCFVFLSPLFYISKGTQPFKSGFWFRKSGLVHESWS